MPKKTDYKKKAIEGVKKMLPKKGSKGGKNKYKSSKGGKSTYRKSSSKGILKRGVKGGSALLQRVQKSPKEGHPMLAAAAGVVVGATVGGLTGSMLSNQKTRKLLGERLRQLMKVAGENVRVLNENRGEIAKSAKEIASSAKTVQKKLRK